MVNEPNKNFNFISYLEKLLANSSSHFAFCQSAHLTVLTLILSSLKVSSGLVVEGPTLQGIELECLPGLHLLPQGVLTEGVETVPGAPVLPALRHHQV